MVFGINFFFFNNLVFADEGIKTKFSNNEAFVTLIKDFIDLNKVNKFFWQNNKNLKIFKN